MPTRYTWRPVRVRARLGEIALHFYVSFVAQVQGLCGTFTWKQQDDFLTPAGDIETSVTAFANKFEVSGDGRCPLADITPLFSCSTYSQSLTFAEAACAILHSPTFQVLGSPSLPPIRSRIQRMQQRVQGHREAAVGPQGNGVHEERAALYFLSQGVSWTGRPGTVPIAVLGGCVWLCPWQGLPVLRALRLCSPLCPGGCPATVEE